MQRARTWHAVVGIVIFVALVIQVWLTIDAPAEPSAQLTGTLRGAPVVGRLVRMISFFTIQSNILCAVVALRLSRRPDEDGKWWKALRLAGLFGITVTGIVYGTVLSEVHVPHGWAEVSTNFVFHYAAPAAVVLGWFLYGPRPRIDRTTMALAFCWPALWSVWTLVHGAITDWYPYPFVDVATHGYVAVLRNALLVLCLLAGVAGLFWFGDRRLRRAPRSTAPEG